MITFGQPRVGNSAFASWFNSITTHERVVHYADIIPHTPAHNLGYSHSGTFIWYKKDMQSYKICSSKKDDCSKGLLKFLLNIKDHSD